MQQEDASIGLSVPQIIELVGIDMEEVVVPGPEDYARDLEATRVVNYNGTSGTSTATNTTGSEAATDNAMYCSNEDIGKGFAERTDALSMTIFTNAQDGAALYVHGLQPAGPQGILRLEDTYVQVCTEKTYILQNDLEGAFANACSMAVSQDETASYSQGNSDKKSVQDNPRNGMGAAKVDDIDFQLSTKATQKAASTWLRIHNQAQHLFEVKMATKAPRLVVINLGIANLARYTEGEYSNTLTFTLMPIVG
jgi:hypothetical protein